MADRIVCLDGYTLNPGDLDWTPIEQLGDFTTYDRTAPGDILDRAAGAPCLLTNKTPLSADTLAQLPALTYVGVLATGVNVVDLDAAREQGVTVTNVPAYSTDSVAQHATAMMLELMRGIGPHATAVRDGKWVASEDFAFTVTPILETTGKTLGLIGLGRIGVAFGKIAEAMGMRVIAHNRSTPSAERLAGLTVELVDMDTVFREADVLSLHCPLTDQTKHLVNADRLRTMKRSAILLNTGRGPLLDAAAVADALHDGTIAGAGLDVLDEEPPPADDPLLSAPHCIITPHVAWCAREARQRLMDIAASNLAAFQRGEPTNVVN